MHTLHGCMGDSEHSARILLTPRILYFPLYFVLRDGEPIVHKIRKASSSPYLRVAGTLCVHRSYARGITQTIFSFDKWFDTRSRIRRTLLRVAFVSL